MEVVVECVVDMAGCEGGELTGAGPNAGRRVLAKGIRTTLCGFLISRLNMMLMSMFSETQVGCCQFYFSRDEHGADLWGETRSAVGRNRLRFLW